MACDDLISQLPPDIKDCILERLSTRDAATTALLSTQWRDAWLRHGCLVFDQDLLNASRWGYYVKDVVETTDNILMRRIGPIKKFFLDISYLHHQHSGWLRTRLDLWCHILRRNGIEELTIYSSYYRFKLPHCIFFWKTIKKLKLVDIRYNSPPTTPRILPNLTSLTLKRVHFGHNDDNRTLVFDIPNLEKLAFKDCTGITSFRINSPKLVTMIYRKSPFDEDVWKWFSHCFRTIQTLSLHFHEGFSIETVTLPNIVTNLRVIKLKNFCFEDVNHLNFVVLLLQKSPHLCELHTKGRRTGFEDEEVVRMLEHPSFTNKDLTKTLTTLKIEDFIGTRATMLFVKAILSTSTALREVVIHTDTSLHSNRALEIAKELLHIPRASRNLQVIFHHEECMC